MTSLLRTAAISALVLGGLATTAAAQKNKTTATPAPQSSETPETSFQELLEQIREGDERPIRHGTPTQTRPRIGPADGIGPPKAPDAGTPPIFPVDDGERRPLPWVGKNATTAFTYGDNNVTHTLSQYLCQDSIADFELISIYQYSAIGHSVGCSYVRKDKPGFVGAFAVPAESDTAAQDQVNNFVMETRRTVRGSYFISDDPVIINFGGKELTCSNVIMGTAPTEGGDRSATTACQIDNWVMRFRRIWQSDADDQTTTVINTLAAAQSAAVDHLASCKALRTRILNMEPSGATGLSYHMEGFPYVERGNACYAGHSVNDDNISFVRLWPDNPDTPMTNDFVTHNGQFQETPAFRLQDMWASVDAADRGPAGFLLLREQANGTITSYTGYSRIPNDARFFQDTVKAYNGEMPPTLVATPNSGGGWTTIAQ